jgi:hypothetical protein
MNSKKPGDFAVVGIHEGVVFLEASEWDEAACRHFVVTLYLPPDEAIRLAEQINLCAVGLGG